MAFEINITEEGNSKVITLKDTGNLTEAEVYSFGALLNGFSLQTDGKKVNVVDGFSSTEDAANNITNGFKSAKLSPFVCRLEKGRYSFDGTDFKVEKFNLGEEAIHGLLFDTVFSVKESGADDLKAFVTLEADYNNKTQGFPFGYTMEVTYTLEKENKLTLTTKVQNTGSTTMPLSDGWHPYFKLGETVNDLEVEFNTDTMVEFDDRLLPSGKTLPDHRFEKKIAFNDTVLDNCFLLKGHHKAACILRDQKTGIQLSIFAGDTYPYLQVYTPPHRKSIAVENLSSVPDAFNNGIGLLIAKPGEVYEFTTTYQLDLIK